MRRAAAAGTTTKTATGASQSRTTARGPPRARAAVTAPQTGTKIAAVHGPRNWSVRIAVASLMTNNSNAVQPRSWTTLRAVGAYEPFRPRMGRRLTMVGTPARLPWGAAAASNALPMTEPTMDTTTLSQSVSPRSVTRRAPAARTRRPTPRLDQRTKRSKVRRVRRDSGTGSTPHSGGLRRRSITWPKSPDIYRIMELDGERGSESLRGLPEF